MAVKEISIIGDTQFGGKNEIPAESWLPSARGHHQDPYFLMFCFSYSTYIDVYLKIIHSKTVSTKRNIKKM